MAGLFNARLLADRFERVTLIERDRFPEDPEIRKGVPRSRQIPYLGYPERVSELLFTFVRSGNGG